MAATGSDAAPLSPNPLVPVFGNGPYLSLSDLLAGGTGYAAYWAMGKKDKAKNVAIRSTVISALSQSLNKNAFLLGLPFGGGYLANQYLFAFLLGGAYRGIKGGGLESVAKEGALAALYTYLGDFEAVSVFGGDKALIPWS